MNKNVPWFLRGFSLFLRSVFRRVCGDGRPPSRPASRDSANIVVQTMAAWKVPGDGRRDRQGRPSDLRRGLPAFATSNKGSKVTPAYDLPHRLQQPKPITAADVGTAWSTKARSGWDEPVRSVSA